MPQLYLVVILNSPISSIVSPTHPLLLTSSRSNCMAWCSRPRKRSSTRTCSNQDRQRFYLPLNKRLSISVPSQQQISYHRLYYALMATNDNTNNRLFSMLASRAGACRPDCRWLGQRNLGRASQRGQSGHETSPPSPACRASRTRPQIGQQVTQSCPAPGCGGCCCAMGGESPYQRRRPTWPRFAACASLSKQAASSLAAQANLRL